MEEEASTPFTGSVDGLIPTPIDINQPIWDQETFSGRLNRFFRITNPLLLFKSRQQYEEARQLVLLAKSGVVPTGTTREDVVEAKVLYDSAYHPDTGEKMNVLGRMSFQVPGGMFLVGILMTFYQRFIYIVIGQWINQSFNAVVNYTNRNAKSDVTGRQIAVAYVGATSGAVAAAAGMNLLVEGNHFFLVIPGVQKRTIALRNDPERVFPKAIGKRILKAPAIVRRWVPFVAVAAANCINIPVMRQRELMDGIIVTDKEGNDLVKSKVAARVGISLVVLSRILIVTPTMITIPVIMQRLERKFPAVRAKGPSLIMQMLLVGVISSVSVPVSCAVFPQRMSLATNKLEKSAQEAIKSKTASVPDRIYFNKGL